MNPAAWMAWLLGGLLLGRSVLWLVRGHASRHWSTVTGHIGEAELERDLTEGVPMIRAGVRFNYEVDGRTYRGNRTFYGDRFWLPATAAARNLISAYQEGQTTTVYYDPENPERAVLEPGIKTRAVAAALLGAGLVVVGFFV